jgi:dienelactone hydrolase
MKSIVSVRRAGVLGQAVAVVETVAAGCQVRGSGLGRFARVNDVHGPENNARKYPAHAGSTDFDRRLGRGVMSSRLAMVAALTLGNLLGSAAAHAALIEEVIKAPVSIRTAVGDVRQDIMVTVFRDDQRKISPYLVLNHGRSANEAERATASPKRYANVARYLVSLGFVVLVPARVGYGETGGPDLENAGRCNAKNFAPGVEAAADEIAAVLERAKALPYVNLSRGLVIGTSYGGLASIRLASKNLPGLVGAVNFSGGSGGDPINRPGNPCSPERLTQLYRSYGAAAKVPSLWLYTPNDLFWGADLPKQWFQSFVKAGGRAQFVELPSYGDNGHMIFTGNLQAWEPAFEQFLRDRGFIS